MYSEEDKVKVTPDPISKLWPTQFSARNSNRQNLLTGEYSDIWGALQVGLPQYIFPPQTFYYLTAMPHFFSILL